MLGKLIKYDLRFGARTLMAACGVFFLFVAIYPRWVNAMNYNEFEHMNVLILVNVVLILGVFGLALTMGILLIQLFNRGLYSDEGYLMHTLPVTPWALVGSKVITTLIWILAALASLFLGAMIGEPDIMNNIIATLRSHFLEFIPYILYYLFFFMSGLTCMYFCIALAHMLVQRGVLLLAFLFGWMISGCMSYLNYILYTWQGGRTNNALLASVYGPFTAFKASMWMNTAYYVLWAGLFYALTVLCMGRRIKLR